MPRLRLSISLAVLLAMIAPLLLTPVAAQQASSVATPQDAAVFYSQLESAGSFSALYQYLHPDAQSFIPEAAVVGWYVNEFAPNGPGVITVTGVEMMSWTWEVTGTTYPNTAVVSFQQPFANGTVVNEVVRLVESNGEWRWFFGRSRAFVDEQIATYGSAPTTSGDPCAGAAAWWAETYPRLPTIGYFFGSFQPNGVMPDPDMMQNYANLFAELYDEQARSLPPSAASTLQGQLLGIFAVSERAASTLGPVMRGNLNPLAEAGALDAGIKSLDALGSSLLSLDTNIQTFLDTCQPTVVFVLGRAGILTPVLPGEAGPGVLVIDCSMFATAAEAQRFFEAAKPGDPHRLDPNNDGLACR